MHRLFFLPQLRGVPLPSRILCGRSPPGSWKGRRPDQDAVEDPAPESWPTAAGADQAAQAAAGRLRAPGESRCHYVHSQEDESGRGRLRPSRIPPGSWKASGRIGKTREIQRRKAGRRQRAQIRPLRLPQAVSERRESPSAIMATVRKMKAAAGVSGNRGSTPGSWKASGGTERPGHCADPSAVADPRCREDGQRQRAQIRPRRPSIIHFDNISIASFFPSGLSCINRETISRILDE